MRQECATCNFIFRSGYAPRGKKADEAVKLIHATAESKQQHLDLVHRIEEVDAAGSNDKEKGMKRRRGMDNEFTCLDTTVSVTKESATQLEKECGNFWPLSIYHKKFPDRPARSLVFVYCLLFSACRRLPARPLPPIVSTLLA